MHVKEACFSMGLMLSLFHFSCLEFDRKPRVNNRPVAVAKSSAEGKQVAGGATVTLDGTMSVDADGDPLSFFWEQVSGIPVSLSDAHASQTSFVAPLSTTTLNFRLTVSDGFESSEPDLVQVSVFANKPPVADAGESKIVLNKHTIHLEGSGTDPDGQAIASFKWVVSAKPAGASFILEGGDTEAPNFTPDGKGQYTLQLVVSDGYVDSLPDIMTITSINNPPSADAGESKSIKNHTSIELTGRGHDVDGDSDLGFKWKLASYPDGATFDLVGENADTCTFTPHGRGVYELELTVSDGEDTSIPDSVIVNAGNNPPVVDAGPDRVVPSGRSIVITGSIQDPDGDATEILWTVISFPEGATYDALNMTSASPEFTPHVPGRYVLQLVAHDDEASSEPDTMVLTAENNPPLVMDVPGELQVQNGSELKVSAYVSDPDGDELNFEWAIISAPSGASYSLFDETTSTVSFTPYTKGMYVLHLTVTDGKGGQAKADVQIWSLNNPPTCDAGENKSTRNKEPVLLAGSAGDLDGDELSYQWTVAEGPDGANYTLLGATTLTPEFTPKAKGTYFLELTVQDSEGAEAVDSIVVTSINNPPEAAAGQNVSVLNRSSIQLSGSGTDEDGDRLVYRWAVKDLPQGASYVFSDPYSAATEFVTNGKGVYKLTFVVSDGESESKEDEITITALNNPPTADAGPDIHDASVGSKLQLSGAGSHDLDDDKITDFRWVQLSGTVTPLDLTDPIRPVITPSAKGTLVFSLEIVTEDGVVSQPDEVQIDVVNTSPIAIAGSDQATSPGSKVTLDGSLSYDPDGDSIVIYKWTQVGGPNVNLDLSVPSKPTFIAPSTTEAVEFELKVSDGTVFSLPDRVSVYSGPDDSTHVFVATPEDGGDDNNPGTMAGPKATLNAAIQEAKKFSPPKTIVVAAGDYSDSDSVDISGEECNGLTIVGGYSPTTWDAIPGERSSFAKSGISISAKMVSISHLVFGGIMAYDCSNLSIINCKFNINGISNVIQGENQTVADSRFAIESGSSIEIYSYYTGLTDTCSRFINNIITSPNGCGGLTIRNIGTISGNFITGPYFCSFSIHGVALLSNNYIVIDKAIELDKVTINGSSKGCAISSNQFIFQNSFKDFGMELQIVPGSKMTLNNNLFYKDTTDGNLVTILFTSQSGTIEFTNNIFENFYTVFMSPKDSLVISNNAFYNVQNIWKDGTDFEDDFTYWENNNLGSNNMWAKCGELDFLTGLFQLDKNSPCIDGGRSTYYTNPDIKLNRIDFNERVRPCDGNESNTAEFDIGPYEYCP